MDLSFSTFIFINLYLLKNSYIISCPFAKPLKMKQLYLWTLDLLDTGPFGIQDIGLSKIHIDSVLFVGFPTQLHKHTCT